MLRFLKQRRTSYEFPKGLSWVNSPALSLTLLRGKPVILHFWTYSCVHSLHTLPYIKRWAKVYEPFGVTVIGIHTPEFHFATENEAVKNMVTDLGITYPVVLDPQYTVWKMFKNTYWPRTLVINSEGDVVYDHAGEGSYAEAEYALQQALLKTGAEHLPAIGPDASLAGAHCYRVTPEVSLGYLRGSVGNIRQFTPDREEAFTDIVQAQEGIPYLHGHFALKAECVEHTRTVAGAGEYVRCKYRAFGVHAVMRMEKGTGEIVVRLDGKPVPPEFRGVDIRERKDGETVVVVKEGRMYELIQSKVYHAGVIELRTQEKGWQLYTFAFEGGVAV